MTRQVNQSPLANISGPSDSIQSFVNISLPLIHRPSKPFHYLGPKRFQARRVRQPACSINSAQSALCTLPFGAEPWADLVLGDTTVEKVGVGSRLCPHLCKYSNIYSTFSFLTSADAIFKQRSTTVSSVPIPLHTHPAPFPRVPSSLPGRTRVICACVGLIVES